MKRELIWMTLFVVVLTSCKRLDGNLYNLTDKISAYKLDDYSGDQDFVLDASYAIPDSLIHLFTLPSKTPDELTSTTIHALYIGDIAQIASDTVILYCHGNKWHMDFYWQRAKLMAHTGGKNRFGVMMFDYRGYGLSEGEPSEEALYADTRAAIDWLKSNGLSSDRLVIYGFSMGSAPACEIMTHGASLHPSKLILEAPFASAEVMAQDGAGLSVPGSFFTNLKIDNAEEIKSINEPLFWMHGTDDMFLGIASHGELVYGNHQGVYKEAHRILGADHGEVPATWGYSAYLMALEDFLER